MSIIWMVKNKNKDQLISFLCKVVYARNTVANICSSYAIIKISVVYIDSFKLTKYTNVSS